MVKTNLIIPHGGHFGRRFANYVDEKVGVYGALTAEGIVSYIKSAVPFTATDNEDEDDT